MKSFTAHNYSLRILDPTCAHIYFLKRNMTVKEHRCTVGVGMENTTTGRQTGVSDSKKTKVCSFGATEFSTALELGAERFTELCGEHSSQKDAFKPAVTH